MNQPSCNHVQRSCNHIMQPFNQPSWSENQIVAQPPRNNHDHHISGTVMQLSYNHCATSNLLASWCSGNTIWWHHSVNSIKPFVDFTNGIWLHGSPAIENSRWEHAGLGPDARGTLWSNRWYSSTFNLQLNIEIDQQREATSRASRIQSYKIFYVLDNWIFDFARRATYFWKSV